MKAFSASVSPAWPNPHWNIRIALPVCGCSIPRLPPPQRPLMTPSKYRDFSKIEEGMSMSLRESCESCKSSSPSWTCSEGKEKRSQIPIALELRLLWKVWSFAVRKKWSASIYRRSVICGNSLPNRVTHDLSHVPQARCGDFHCDHGVTIVNLLEARSCELYTTLNH